MSELLRLSEHPLSQQWLIQFRSSNDRALAAQLLNQLKLVSAREFESGLENTLTSLQNTLDATIAVYPVAPPMPEEIAGYDPFSGGVARDPESDAREIGRRRRYGSEDRVGHILAKLQERSRKGTASRVECQPTLKQLKTQAIRHVVLVDDICGSGERLRNYWKHAVPRRIKSLLSLKRLELWIVLFGITRTGRNALTHFLPNFPIGNHLITVLPESDLRKQIAPEIIELCTRYSEDLGIDQIGLGYRGSSCPVVFEHGCPNNLPAVLWKDGRKAPWLKGERWSALFPNRAIPTEMRLYFDDDGKDRGAEALWRANQPKLALGLLEALDDTRNLRKDDWLLLCLLGLSLRGVPESSLAGRLLIGKKECRRLLEFGARRRLYDMGKKGVTLLGKEFVERFRRRYHKPLVRYSVGRDPKTYYPSQCEGKFRKPGKTVRS